MPSYNDSISIGAVYADDKVRLQRSQADLSLRIARGFPEISLPCFFLNSAMK